MASTINVRRGFHIGRVLLRHALGRVLPKRLARSLPPRDLSSPERLRRILEEIGGTFIKLGQMLALQPDLVSLEHCNALFKLLDRVEPFPFSDAEQIFHEEFGETPGEVFDSIDRSPLATASIGQVHVAYLEGAKVAVKIQRPTVEREFEGDIGLMKLAVRLIGWLPVKRFDFMVEPLTEFISWTAAELDFRNEAVYMQRLGVHAAENPNQRVPDLFSKYTSRRVLVAEFLEADTLLSYLRARERGDEVLIERLRRIGFVPETFAANIIDNFLGDAYRRGVYHADLHPANLLIMPGNVVGYVDFGITGVLSAYGRERLITMTHALARGDLDTLARHFLDISVIGDDASRRTFEAGLDECSRGWFIGDPERRQLRTNITRVMGDMLQLSRQANVLPATDIIKYIRSAIALDGLITRFAPDFEIGAYLASSCARQLAAVAQQKYFAPTRLLEWSSAGEHLLRNGAARAVSALDHTIEDLGRPAPRPTVTEDPVRSGVVELALATLFISVVVTRSPSAPSLGPNLWTAGAVFVAAAAILLLRSVWQLSRRSGVA